MGRYLAWFVTLPVLVVGVFAGHELGYRFAFTDPHERAHALEATGHDYFAYAKPFIAVAIAVVALALGLRVRRAVLGRRSGRTPPAAVALLAPVAFLILEVLERMRLGELTADAMASRQIAYGLLLQIPFAVAALLVARILGSVADVVGELLRTEPFVPHVWWRQLVVWPVEVELPRVPVASLAYGLRGPPLSTG